MWKYKSVFYNKNINNPLVIRLVKMEVSEAKWVNSYFIYYGVKWLRFGGLQ